MGMWGFELYQNDTSLNVKDDFEKQYETGEPVQEITNQMINIYRNILNDPKEGPLFWFALADTQWELGVLLPEVKDKALYCIDRFHGLLGETALNHLRVKLISNQPEKKKFVRKKTYRCQWDFGDVFAYRLESELAQQRGLDGRYFLIQKIDEVTWHPGHIVPVVYVKITQNSRIPTTAEEYNQLEYVQTSFTRYEERFLPIDMSCPEEDIAEKSKINYQVDDYGFLPQYRAILLNTSKKVIPSKLIYIGNFQNVIRPQKEFIPHSKLNLICIAWQQFNETFETKMIKKYCGHNLRELCIYKNKVD